MNKIIVCLLLAIMLSSCSARAQLERDGFYERYQVTAVGEGDIENVFVIFGNGHGNHRAVPKDELTLFNTDPIRYNVSYGDYIGPKGVRYQARICLGNGYLYFNAVK